MKKLLLFLTLLSVPVISAFAWPNLPDSRDMRGCRNADQISYQAQDLARETRQLADRGRGRWNNRWSDEARRLTRAAMELSQAARNWSDCRWLERMFTERVEPAFRDLMAEMRGPRRDDTTDELRDVRRAYQELKRELYDDNGRGPRPGPGRGPDRGPGHDGPWDGGRGDGRGPDHGPGPRH